MSRALLLAMTFSMYFMIVHAVPLVHRDYILKVRDASDGTYQSVSEEHIVIVDKNQTCGSAILSRLGLTSNHPDVHYLFDNEAFKGFAAKMTSEHLDNLARMTDVLHIDVTSKIMSSVTVRTSSPWGLQRVSSADYIFGDPKALHYDYSYDDEDLGKNVDIYIVDTGIYTQHKVFSERARMGFSFEPDFTDHEGHGTHVSGIVGGAILGVASEANLIGVKVLGEEGSGTSSDAIAGMDYVIKQHMTRKAAAGYIGSVMSLSWGLEGVSGPIQTAIDAALGIGIHVSIAAGNAAKDACSFSPSLAGGMNSAAIVVGSVNEAAQVSSFSNTGPCVDLYAPGEDIISSWIGAPNILKFLSGTSMACPHVTGVMAYLMANDHTLASNPIALKAKVLELSLRDVVHGTGSGGSELLLLNNGNTGAVDEPKLADFVP